MFFGIIFFFKRILTFYFEYKFFVDVIAQAKSGTGKTLVFSVVILEVISTSIPLPQALVLAPTREIAVQIKEVIVSVGKYIPNLNVQVFIGGIQTSFDSVKIKGCHAVVGSPGRIKAMIDSSVLQTNSIRLFILDEADKLLDSSFANTIKFDFFFFFFFFFFTFHYQKNKTKQQIIHSI